MTRTSGGSTSAVPEPGAGQISSRAQDKKTSPPSVAQNLTKHSSRESRWEDQASRRVTNLERSSRESRRADKTSPGPSTESESIPEGGQSWKKSINVVTFLGLFVLVSHFCPTNKISDDRNFFSYYKQRIDTNVSVMEKIRVRLRKFCLVNLSVNDIPTLIYLTVKIIGSSFLKDAVVAVCFPGLNSDSPMAKRKIIKQMQKKAFDSNWIDGKQTAAAPQKSVLVDVASEVGGLLTDSSIGLVTRACEFMGTVLVKIIRIITFKLRGIICGISSIILLKLYVFQLIFRLIKSIYRIVQSITLKVAEILNDLALVTVDVIEETGRGNIIQRLEPDDEPEYNLNVSRGVLKKKNMKKHEDLFDELSDLTDSESESSWRPPERDAEFSSGNTTMGTISPNETKDLVTDLIDHEDISPTALFSSPTKRRNKREHS